MKDVPTRTAIYARYSSDHQRSASIEDQVHQCRKRIDLENWQETTVYADHAISGADSFRPQYQKMLEDGRNGAFDILLAEALDRLSRDQENIASLYKQMTFAEVRVITLAEGDVNELHVGLKGTMNALFLKDLADKTRRGLEGRVRQGMSGGGNAYGYTVVKRMAADGTPIRGEREINLAESIIVQRIFTEFAAGRSPRSIAHDLNAEGVPGPRNGAWGPSTIHGNWRRGTGVLNNELYIGRLIWNRQRFIKDPKTGKRQARLNPPVDWIVEEVPHLRVIDQETWDRVKQRQQGTRRMIAENNTTRSERARRPRYLLSGLLRCGQCGGGFSKISQHHYGCSTARNKGTCDNLLTIRRDAIEASVLAGLQTHLMHPDCVEVFIEEFNREFNRLAAAQDAERVRIAAELAKTNRDIQSLIEAIKSGVPGAAIKDEMQALENRRVELIHTLEQSPPSLPRLHPNLSKVYRDKVDNLVRALSADSSRAEAAEAIRGLIKEIRLVPVGDQLDIELYGELAALFDLAQNKHPQSNDMGVQVTMVAGAGFEPATFRL